MRSGNPALNDDTFTSSSYQDKPWWDEFDLADKSTTMSIEGTAEKTGILLGITILTALFTAFSMPETFPLMMLGYLGGFIIAMIVIFSRSTNPVLICLYAAFEGMALGGITWYFESIPELQGIGIVAALLTFGILGVMLTIYRMGLIHWDENTRIAVISAVFGILIIYLITIIGSFVGFQVPYIHGAGPWGIAFSVFVVGIASFCLAADFDFIERGVLSGSPKELEWRAAFGLMVTLIWLYIEILHLLAKIAIATR
ncbi:MAG: Bax inhibitor-1/YccA family protein [Candidatus Thermoplasmatota archaeon]|nr:Bax inhibitor-1/YccA family protein [Candidatus Thermoplasmatota archaeon]MEC8954730.1 Bax inhibitor-1/YccA family protein [Candidatus Thermoplasmatota archaeon]MEC9393821.1 Bax inhibitor-1/YccA family protein [Candidatus Thermoplasmatota archaeon]MEE3304414.1 Bax inhibitor-1/YccA family protein [Candidatus Thermoplasmatota archaeon]